MTYDAAVAFLDSLVNYERHPVPQAMRAVRLERMRGLCRHLGDPQRRFRSVLVSGTNGKGSVCAMLYSMLRESGLRAGLYTSPHVEHLRERIRCWTASGGERAYADDWISEADLAAALGRLEPAVEELRKQPDGPPTYFEAMTAAAFLHFAQREVEVAVLEVGLGGRLDATNVAEASVAVIGPVALDHTDVLGTDRVLVAREKAGIIRPRQTVLTAAQHEGVDEVLRATCEEQGAVLLRFGRDLTVRVHRHDVDGLQLTITGSRGLYEDLEVPLIGRHQAENAALAVGALEALSDTGVPHALVVRGLARVAWHGRMDIVQESPLVILDGAHNPHAFEALAAALRELCANRRVHLVLGLSADKPAEPAGQLLGPLATSVTCTQSRHPRALDPLRLAKLINPFCHGVHVMPDAADAYTYVVNAAAPTDAVVVTGSLFLVGELRAALNRAGRPGLRVQAGMAGGA